MQPATKLALFILGILSMSLLGTYVQTFALAQVPLYTNPNEVRVNPINQTSNNGTSNNQTSNNGTNTSNTGLPF